MLVEDYARILLDRFWDKENQIYKRETFKNYVRTISRKFENYVPFSSPIAINKRYLDHWEKIGNRNIWISESYDPPFDSSMIVFCENLLEIVTWFVSGNWCLGQGFAIGDVCFINQTNGGDEYLVIKQDESFESFSIRLMIENKTLGKNIIRILSATKEECLALEY